MPENQKYEQDILQDRRMEVETPEHVSIEYPLAGLGSRFTALLIDSVLLFASMLVVPFVLFLAGAALESAFPGLRSAGVVVGIYIICSFALFWGYFFFFEAFRDGQTPGKKLMSIRVVMDGGYPITLEAAAIRNLIRLIDILPSGGLLGGVFMLLSAKAKRLGDMAASTVVVRELPIEFPDVTEAPPATAPPRLKDAAFDALEKYVDRRRDFDPATRTRIARQVASHLYPLEPPGQSESADKYLVRFHADERVRRLSARLGERVGSPAAAALLRAKRVRWEEFRATTLKARRLGLSGLGEAGVGNFAGRYRELTADLARARTYGASAGTIYALERLVGIGHNLFYRSARQSLSSSLNWLLRGFPALVRKRWAPIAAAAALFFGFALLSYTILRARPELERQLVSSEIIARAEEAPSRRAARSGYIDVPPLGHAFLASAIVSNNVQVSFLAFAAGVTAGIGTSLVLVINGLHLGSVLAAFHNRDVLDVIAIFVLPHGIIELTAICIAGGAGLWMGSGLFLPGRRTRRVAFTERAKEGVSLIGGVILLLVWAGLIEGFVSPSRTEDWLKLGFSALAAILLALYLLLAGRTRITTPLEA